jgi:hypothetical protein
MHEISSNVLRTAALLKRIMSKQGILRPWAYAPNVALASVSVADAAVDAAPVAAGSPLVGDAPSVGDAPIVGDAPGAGDAPIAPAAPIASSQQPSGDHKVTRYFSVVADSTLTYDQSNASRYDCWGMEDAPVDDLHADHFRYTGWVRFYGTVTLMVKDGSFVDWLEAVGMGEGAEFPPPAGELWEGDSKQAAFEGGLSSCGLLPWWDESPPLEEWEVQKVPFTLEDLLGRMLAGPVQPSFVFQFRLELELDAPTTAGRIWLDEWRYEAMRRRRERLATLSKSSSSSPVSSPPSSVTIPDARTKWEENEVPRPELYGQFDPTKYGLPHQFHGGARAA